MNLLARKRLPLLLVAASLTVCTAFSFVAQNAFGSNWGHPSDHAFAKDTADLSLQINVARTTALVGDTLVIVITLHNDGPDLAEKVQVDWATMGLRLITAVSEDPGAKIDSRHDNKKGTGKGKWKDVRLENGQSYTLTVTVVADEIPATFAAEVKHSSADDPDSRPGKGTAEDDNGTSTFSDAGTSAGAEGGLESNGSLAGKLAQLLYNRRAAAATMADAGIVEPVHQFRKKESIDRARKTRATSAGDGSSATNSASSQSHDLRTAIPEIGPEGFAAREVSPSDLLPVTNAIDLVAVDYARPDGHRLGVVFAAATESGQVYEHTKVVCDRLRGATLEAIERLAVMGHEFVVSQLVQADGTVDYALSFVVYDKGTSFEIDSRFILGDYVTSATGAPTYNYQVWSETQEDMVEIASAMLNTLADIAPLSFSTDERRIEIPDVYVRTGHYHEGELLLEVVNRAGATRLELGDGTVARFEGGERSSFQYDAPLPLLAEDDPYETEVRIDVGPMFDADFVVTSDSSLARDLLYLADGSWSWAIDPDGRIHDYSVRPAVISRLREPGTFAVERGGRLSGDITEWATLFRYLRPNGTAMDLSDYTYVEFMASGRGTIRVQIEKESLAGTTQFGQTMTLTQEPRTYRVWFDQLSTRSGTQGFTPEDVVLLSFNAENVADEDGQLLPGTSFVMEIDDVRFRGAEGDIAAQRPDEAVLHPIYPNPVRGVAQIRYDLQEAGTAQVTLFDVLGRRVAVLASGWHASGPHSLAFDSSALGSGMYFTWLETEFVHQSRGLVVK